MKIAITGASGYVGSFLMNELTKNADIEPVFLSASKKKSPYTFTDYSIDNLSHAFMGVDVVVHLAAKKNVDAYSDLIANTDITNSVVEACLNANVSQIIFTSSISVYSYETKLPWKETDSADPDTLYGASKLMSEHILRIKCGRKINYTILRLAHVIGGNMPGPYMIPTFFKKASEGQNLKVMGRSVAKRELVDVKDVCRVIRDCLLNEDTYCRTINVGSGEGLTNLEIARTIAGQYPSVHIHYDDAKDEGIRSSYMDISKLKSLKIHVPEPPEMAIKRICNENL